MLRSVSDLRRSTIVTTDGNLGQVGDVLGPERGSRMERTRERRWVTADAVVGEVLRRFPGARQILLQHGGMFHAKTGDMYASFLPLTVAEYASRSQIDIEGLLDLLNAAAETDEFARRPNGSHRSGGRQAGLGRRGSTIGYTGAYREPDGADVDEVVAVQTARGPE
jgi:hypothetical protein